MSKASITGYIDAITHDRLYGWAWDPNDPERRLTIEIRCGEALVGTLVADQLRPDLRTNGIGDGRHAFEFDLATLDPGVDRTTLSVRVVGEDGEVVPLDMRLPEELVRAGEGEVGHSLRRMVEMLTEMSSHQKEVWRAAQAAFIGTQDMLRQLPAGVLDTKLQEVTSEVERVSEELRAHHDSLERRMADLEVFVIRLDTALHSMDETLRKRKPESRDPLLRGMVLVLLVMALAAGAYVLAV